ncbi:hypothetical protein ACFRFL_23640 [Streptomyces sp. NPDC056708]|uniref:hypothetical protein n=1 Tax=unclassified Streptomyces TaxID=2593676 RepID=UPI0036CABE32
MNVIPHQGRTDHQRTCLPYDLAAKIAAYYCFAARRDDGTDRVVHELLRCRVRERGPLGTGVETVERPP